MGNQHSPITLTLSSKRRLELLSLLAIHPTHRQISVKKLGCFIGKLHFMHLAIPGSIEHIYSMEIALTRAQASMNATTNLAARFHHDIKF